MNQPIATATIAVAQNSSPPAALPTASALPGANILLMGPAGTGKTYSIGTLVDAGVEVFFLALEPGIEALIGYYTDPIPKGRGLKFEDIPKNLHWKTVKAPKASFAELVETAEKVNTMSLDILAKVVDPNRSKHNRFIEILKALNNFVDDRTGESFGSVDSWGAGRALVMDGMAGLNNSAMSLVIGGKPVRNQADWQIAQDQIERIIRNLTDNCSCWFILLAHVERETDAILGGIKIMVSTLGRALAPKLPPMFSDVILAVREGDKFTWDTANSQADVKTRNLPIKSGVNPDFGQIVKKWQDRGGVL